MRIHIIRESGQGAESGAWRAIVLLVSVAIACALGPAVRAQCPADWLPGEGHPGVTGDLPVWALTPWDPDGFGHQPPVLVAGGGFLGAGNVASFGIAAWDGAAWSALGDSALSDQVFALTVYNGDLIAAGDFVSAGGQTVNHIARWDGAAWHALGAGFNGNVRALAVFGGELYAGGFFDHAGAVTASGIARWNGSTWRDVGGGLSAGIGGGIAAVFAMTVFDGKLVAAGGFATAGGAPAKNVASWSGSAWTSMAGNNPAELFSAASALAVYNGQLILAANVFSVAGGSFLRSTSQWDPATSTWLSMGNGPNDLVDALGVFGGFLYAGGVFTAAGGVGTPDPVARWNGATWSALPSGPGVPGRRANSFAVFGGELVAGGLSTKPDGDQTSQVGRFDGAAWHDLGGGVDNLVTNVASLHDELYLGGAFTHAGDIAASRIARRDASGAWDSLDGGLTGDCCGSGTFVGSMAVFEDSLVVSGSFTSAGRVPVPTGVARWDGETWSPFGSVFATNLFVSDGVLHGLILGGIPSTVARWNPATAQWQPLGALPANVLITTFTTFEGDLIAAGLGFGGAPAAVYRWKEQTATWQPMGGTFGFNPIQALAVFDGELIAGGFFDPSGGGPPECIIRWDAATSSWQPLGGGLWGGVVWDLRVFDDALIAGGQFSLSGGLNTDHVARWDGSAWSPLGEGASDEVLALGEQDGDLLLGGWFISAGGAPNGHWARWGSPCPDPWTDLGHGLAGVSGIPSLVGTGTLQAGSPTTLVLSNAAPSAPAGLFVGLTNDPTSFKGGTLVPVPPALLLPFTTSAAGTVPLAFPWPAGLPSAFSLYHQFAIQDAAAIHGVALSHALKSTTP